MSKKTATTKSTTWIIPGILLAGTLLLIGAIAAHNGTLIIVTFLIMAISVTSARSGGDQDRDDGTQRKRRR